MVARAAAGFVALPMEHGGGKTGGRDREKEKKERMKREINKESGREEGWENEKQGKTSQKYQGRMKEEENLHVN